jgi:hypothetical protein
VLTGNSVTRREVGRRRERRRVVGGREEEWEREREREREREFSPFLLSYSIWSPNDPITLP